MSLKKVKKLGHGASHWKTRTEDWLSIL